MADRMGITKSAISAYENERETPSFDKLPTLRSLLEVSLDDLICGDAHQRSNDAQQNSVAEPRAVYQVPEISREERRLLRAFRGLTEKHRRGSSGRRHPDAALRDL